MPNNIILTGFMGTGKSAAGRILAVKTGKRFFDTDDWIAAGAGKSIPQIFAEDGETAFRQWEELAATTLAEETGCVIATGGKLMLDAANALELGASGATVCLTAQPKTILKRIESKKGERPLLHVADPAAEIRRLLAKREAGYGAFPQIRTDGYSPAQVADRIVAKLNAGMPSKTPSSISLSVRHPTGSYPVIVGQNLLSQLRRLANISGALVVVSDGNVAPLYAHVCRPDLLITLPAGERHKTLQTMAEIYRQLADAGIDRSATIVGLGGGVIGDMAGFAAASYMRGVSSVPCPTSLLAMVDASVGGKTGVDLPQGKNLVGAFKQPVAVLVDSDTLSTLPAEELAAGLAENIKHGIIGSPALLKQIERFSQANDGAVSRSLLTRSIQVKQRVVEADPFESGQRMTLNLGHTFGHAIEQVSGYAIRHGQGVAIGLVCAAHLSAKLGYCSPDLQTKIEGWARGVKLPIRLPAALPAEQLWQAMGSDKKKKGKKRRFVLMRGVGAVFVAEDVAKSAVLETWKAVGAS